MKINRLILPIFLMLFVLFSCSKEQDSPPLTAFGEGNAEYSIVYSSSATDEELDLVLQDIDAVRSLYNSFNVRKALVFGLPSPIPHYENGELVVKDNYSYLQDFTEEGRAEFIARYRKNWSLLSSNLSS